VLWKAVSQTKYCCSLKVKICPQNYLTLATPLASARAWITSVFFFGAQAFLVLKSTSGAMNSVQASKSVYLFAKHGLLKVAPSQINCSPLQTVKGFWKLVSKDRFLKLKNFAQKCTRRLKAHTCVRVHFIRWSKSNLKTEIEW